MNLSDKLLSKPLLFTVVPIRDNKTGDPVHDEKILKNLSMKRSEIVKVLSPIKRLNAVNVPELIEENHEGKPRYNSIYTRMLARGIADDLKVDAIVNKVVVHIETYDDFVAWLKETSSLGVKNIIFVGGNTRHHKYPGPSVSEANITTNHLLTNHVINEVNIGNICLPERRDEAKKMLFKTLTGARFFTTQMLFDSKQISDLIMEYDKQCLKAGVHPGAIILSFAPLKSTADLNLLDFLGVDLPEKIKSFILEEEGISASSIRSIQNAANVYSGVLETLEKIENRVKVGINIEQLTKSNLSSSVKMLEYFSKIIDLDRNDLDKMLTEFN